MKSDTSIELVADYFIRFLQERGDLLTNLKLQKLLYYAQAWYLALHNKPLFSAKMEAWIHGPVSPVMYQRFKHYGHRPIIESPKNPKLSKKTRDHLDEILEVYSQRSAFELEMLTHQSDPWIKARGNIPIDQPSTAEISLTEMKKFFKKKMKENEHEEEN